MLRDELGFDGVIVADWRIITDGVIAGEPFPARAWGVEHLSPSQRMAKAITAGVDQFGGETCVELLIELVESGTITEALADALQRETRDRAAAGRFFGHIAYASLTGTRRVG